MNYKNSLLSKRMFIKSGTIFFFCIGIISSIIGIVSITFPNSLNYGWIGLACIFLSALIISIFSAFPRANFSKVFSCPDTKITVKVGDIFNQEEHLVIGFSDTFDTEIGDIISATSMQGQFLSKIYGNNRNRLDQELETILKNKEFREDNSKKIGKNKRYDIGTTVTLSGQNRKFFCCAYSEIGNNLKATSDIKKFWISLQNLWEEIRIQGEQKAVAMPTIGTKLSRISGISYKLPIYLIFLSFIINSRIQPITKE
ncbi:MAG: DUF6430 domain-containing protein, partial [Bacteroidales bacterium]|nr:DUF6430 domain-containing protein [Bacteroidales bacterium]